MVKLRVIEHIFSIVNHPSYKQITFLGLPVYKKYFATDEDKILYKQLPVSDKKIVFMNYLGKSFGCNPKYILEELLHRNLDLDIVWAVKNPERYKSDFPKNVRLVEYKSKDFLKELSSAKVWVANHHLVKQFALGLPKKDNQLYIQTWHGSLGIKKIEKDVKSLVGDKDWEKYAIKNSNAVDMWISNSSFESDVYRKAFWNVNNIKMFGHPRNDIFFKSAEQKDIIIKKVRSCLNIQDDKKILLYAPSFKDTTNLESYSINVDMLRKALSEKFGSEWAIVLRLHPSFRKRQLNSLKILSESINASDYPDMQELMLTADVLVTDYSSCIFDFMLSKKPAFIFANNINEYEQERGFYYPLSQTPFLISQNNDELSDNIKIFDENIYRKKIETFLAEKGCVEDGHASEKVADVIENFVKNGNPV